MHVGGFLSVNDPESDDLLRGDERVSLLSKLCKESIYVLQIREGEEAPVNIDLHM